MTRMAGWLALIALFGVAAEAKSRIRFNKMGQRRGSIIGCHGALRSSPNLRTNGP